MADENEESDEEIGEWSKRLKQIKFQARLDKKKPITGRMGQAWLNNGREYGWGGGGGVKQKIACQGLLEPLDLVIIKVASYEFSVQEVTGQNGDLKI